MIHRFTRRRLLASGIAVAGTVIPLSALAQSGSLPATPACGDDDAPTRPQTAGPFYTPDSPLKADFRGDGPGGETVLLSGFVLSLHCAPLAQATVELWHADADGAYDNSGYRFRGHQVTDGQGRFGFTTIRPGLYPGRTPHYHVRVTPQGGKTLTTQLYFPGEPLNDRDGIFDPALLMATAAGEDGHVARFDFIVET